MIGRKERSATLTGQHASRPTQTVPSGTGPFLNAFQAVNCQATIILSLRDNNLVRRVSTNSTPHHAAFGGDDLPLIRVSSVHTAMPRMSRS
jgi:hypothetical protein